MDILIAAPVIVTGPARSGTSILFELMWLDPTLRGPLAWGALHPVVPPEAPSDAQRLAMSECEQEIWADDLAELLRTAIPFASLDHHQHNLTRRRVHLDEVYRGRVFHAGLTELGNPLLPRHLLHGRPS